jgi:glycosyltransferase involved in cell wall biosynthesis
LSNKIKILFVIANAELSGAEKQLLLLASHLDKNKFNAEICCLEGEGTFTDAIEAADIPLHIINRKRSFDLKRLFHLIRLINKEKYQIVHSFTWSANQYARLARLFLRFILVSGERGRNLEPINIENTIDKILSPLSNHTVFNSNIQLQKYYKEKNQKNKPVSVIFNGVDADKFIKKDESYFKSIFNLSENSILIGTVGNFSIDKNFEMFIDVCEKILTTRQNIYFVAVGDMKGRTFYQDIIRRKNLENKLILVGRRNDIEKILSGLDVFLLTSTSEGMPNVILEAMASEVPVISTNVDGCNEIIKNGESGFLVDIDDVNKMVSKIILLLDDSVLKKKVIQKALKTIQSKFSLEKMVINYESLYLKQINKDG